MITKRLVRPKSSLLLVAVALSALVAEDAPASGIVDPFVGTAGTGHTTPAATCPFGLVQAGPDTGFGDWAHCSGYQHGDTNVYGFSQTHLSGTGRRDLADVRILPFFGDVVQFLPKSDESAAPGIYEVTLGGADRIRVRATATERVALYDITSPCGCPNLLFDTAWHIDRRPPGFTATQAADVRFESDRRIVGTLKRNCWVPRTIHFVAEFSRPVVGRAELPRAKNEQAPSWALSFGEAGGLQVKVALSTRSVEGASRNLQRELPGWDFAPVAEAADRRWNELLNRCEVSTTPERRRTLMTALYHLFFQPNDISDAGEPAYYSTLSLWDTFRAAHPLYAILCPERVPDLIRTMVVHQEHFGYLPLWTLGGFENQCMIGTHSVPVIVDAWCLSREKDAPKELKTVDWGRAYAAIRNTLRERHEGRVKENWAELERYGYYPCDLVYPEPVSRTLECSYDDACAARLARGLGKLEDAAFFVRRSQSWRNLFDKSTGFFRPRRADGSWLDPFDPVRLGRSRERNLWFTEGNAWQYLWHVLQDPDALVETLGGAEAFGKKLEAMFNQPTPADQGDVSGLIGQYAHGNEPSHHAIYLFNWAHRPDLVGRYVKEVCDKFYGNGPNGLCGNDDCGQMSAWYVFACLGFYPVDPCGGEFVLGFPQVDRLTLRLPGLRPFTVVRESGAEPGGPVMLNGRPLAGFKLTREQIRAGGELHFCRGRKGEGRNNGQGNQK